VQRVTLDTNIYVSALNFGGKPAQLLGMAQAGAIRIDISDAIMAELMRVLREDFAWDGYRLHFMRQRLLEIASRVTPTRTLKVVDDPDDDRILECAVEAGSEFIVTNDKAILRLGEYGGIKIIRVVDFLQQIYPAKR
jgi:putative PIN family toxin of toxin-antitoxin system